MGEAAARRRLMRGRLANTVRLRVAAETQPLIRLRAGPQTPSPQKGRHFFPKTSTILTKRLQPAPPAHTVVTQLVRGDFVCWSSFHCFFWAAGPMLRSSWPGGALPTAAAGRGRRPGRSRRQRAGAGGGGSLPQPAAHRGVGLYRRVGECGRAYLPAVLLLLVFALRVGHLCAAGRRKYRLSPSKFPVRQLKSKLSYRLSGILRSYQIRKAVHTMTQQFRYVGGHIEVFSESGEFLFSADTMQEAWEELSA